jgi:hypothetical protein
MEQRPLRLGDIVDDYCPRERRVTNHAIVAIIEDAIRQTRCTTCDAEHVYKHAREPRRRKGDTVESLYDQVLADTAGAQLVPARPTSDGVPEGGDVPQAAPLAAAAADGEPGPDADRADAAEPESGTSADLWPAHRQLIRASLPRTENDPPTPRPIPEFTMYQRQPPRARGGFGFRHSGGWSGNGHDNGHGHGNANGNVNGNVDGNRGPSGPRHGRPGRHRGKHKRPR